MNERQIRKHLKWNGDTLFLNQLQVGFISYIGPFVFGKYGYGKETKNAADATTVKKYVEDAVILALVV